MSVDSIGFVVMTVGFLCFIFGARFAIYLLATSILLGSSSAIFLGSSGQIQPGHLMLLFATPVMMCYRRSLHATAQALLYPRPGFWLLSISLVSCFGSYLLPRLLAGYTQINAIGESEVGTVIMLTPLAPVGGNLSQSIYMLGDLLCFLTVVGAGSLDGGIVTLGRATLLMSILTIIFAGLDLVTFYTHTAFLMDPIRNAHYSLHLDEETNGLKRIVGSYTEASSFSSACLGSLGFTGTLLLRGRWLSVTLPVSAMLIALIIMSTSSTGVVSLIPLLVLLYISAFNVQASRQARHLASLLIVGFPIVVAIIVLITLLDPALNGIVSGYLNTIIFDKSASQSGVERGSWNSAGLQNFLDTYGLGAGLGSVRASSFLVAVLANIGWPGACLFTAFFFSVLYPRSDAIYVEDDIRAGARTGCVALLIASALSATLVDLGLPFFFLAGLASTSKNSEARGSLRINESESRRTLLPI